MTLPFQQYAPTETYSECMPTCTGQLPTPYH